MPRVQCSYCGLPFNVRQVEPGRPYYCCSGCALLSRLPQPGAGGEFPVTPALVVALCAGIAFFNQVLFWTPGIAMARDQRAEQALLFAQVSAGLGVAVWLTLVVTMARAASRSWTDAAAAVVTLAGLVGAGLARRPAGWAVLVNAALALWLARGWGKQRFARKKSLTI
jgi:hypothetical protein